MIVRRERPHPGAQLSFTDHDGHRFLATLTDLDGDAVELERLHRARASTEDRIRAAKQTGLGNLPFRDFDHNAGLAGDLAARPRPHRLDPAPGTRRRARPLRAQDAALPTAAHRRPAGLPRPPRHPAPATHLALGRPPRHRVRTPRRAAPTSTLTKPVVADHHAPFPAKRQRSPLRHLRLNTAADVSEPTTPTTPATTPRPHTSANPTTPPADPHPPGS